MECRKRFGAAVLVLAALGCGSALAREGYSAEGQIFKRTDPNPLVYNPDFQPSPKTLKLKPAKDNQATSPKLSKEKKRRMRQPR